MDVCYYIYSYILGYYYFVGGMCCLPCKVNILSLYRCKVKIYIMDKRISMYLGGDSISEIARQEGVSRQAILWYLKNKGVYGGSVGVVGSGADKGCKVDDGVPGGG